MAAKNVQFHPAQRGLVITAQVTALCHSDISPCEPQPITRYALSRKGVTHVRWRAIASPLSNRFFAVSKNWRRAFGVR